MQLYSEQFEVVLTLIPFNLCYAVQEGDATMHTKAINSLVQKIDQKQNLVHSFIRITMWY